MTFKGQSFGIKAWPDRESPLRFAQTTMEAREDTPIYPVFATLRTLSSNERYNGVDYDWLMCLIKNTDGTGQCSETYSNFDYYLMHLENDHGIVLKSTDICNDCSLIFRNRTEAVSHYLQKALKFEECEMTYSMASPQNNLFLRSVFQGIKTIQRYLWDGFNLIHGE